MSGGPSPIEVEATPWIAFRRPRPEAGLRLFCFPYAGGGASVFRRWPTAIPAEIEVCPVQPPGRENRIRERAISSLDEMIEQIHVALGPLLEERPYALLGYSLGATVAFEWAHRLSSTPLRQPSALVAAARGAPSSPLAHPPMYHLPENEFVQRLLDLEGTPPEITENAELMELLIPLLRADFEIHDTYRATEREPLDCPTFVFGGRDDHAVPREQLESWRAVTRGPFRIEYLPGDHFSLIQGDALPAAVARTLLAIDP